MAPTIPTTIPVTLQDAIAAFESVDTSLKDAGGKQISADEKFRAAQTAKQVADVNNATAVAAYNSALESLITAAQASKIAV